MQTQLTSRSASLASFLVTVLALAGCGNKGDGAAGNLAPGGTPAQVQQNAQQQAAERAAYFNSHAAGKGTGHNPGAAPPYTGHP